VRARKASVDAELEALDDVGDSIFGSTEVETWLVSIGLEEYWPRFKDNGYEDLESVRDFVTEQVLRDEIGATDEDHLRQFLIAIPVAELPPSPRPSSSPRSTRLSSPPVDTVDVHSETGLLRGRRASAEAEIDAIDDLRVDALVDKLALSSGRRESSMSSSSSLDEIARQRARASFAELPDIAQLEGAKSAEQISGDNSHRMSRIRDTTYEEHDSPKHQTTPGSPAAAPPMVMGV